MAAISVTTHTTQSWSAAHDGTANGLIAAIQALIAQGAPGTAAVGVSTDSVIATTTS